MTDICHACDGTGKDSDSVAAASYPDHCFNCGGSGAEPNEDCGTCGYPLQDCQCTYDEDFMTGGAI